MKFSDIKPEVWPDLKPYLDTCLLPLTGMSGKEAPWEAAEALERLRDVMDLLEIPYKGRIVTYPALHYYSLPGQFAEGVSHLCRNLKAAGFRYVFLASADPLTEVMQFPEADLHLTGSDLAGDRKKVDERVREVWQTLLPAPDDQL